MLCDMDGRVWMSSWCSRKVEFQRMWNAFRIGFPALCPTYLRRLYSFSPGLGLSPLSGNVSRRNSAYFETYNISEKYGKLWRDLFSNPSQWWDYRLEKGNSRFPDFKHKMTGEALWLDNKRTPPWVMSELGAFKGNSKSAIHEKLWRELFSEPSKWWDHRPRKGSPSIPDFRHKRTGEVLWVDNRRTPQWVTSLLPALGPVTLQLHIFTSIQSLARYNKAGHYVKTIDLYRQMQREGITADHYIFLHVLNACAALRFLEEGRRIHRQIVKTDCELNPFVSNSLVNMYAKCGSLEDARRVFDKMPIRTVVSWTSMILGCVKCGQGLEALELLQQMRRDGVEPDSTSFVVLINACSSMGALEEGRRVHKQIMQSGCESEIYVSTSLIDMYSKCGRLEDAWSVFNKMPTRNVASWTAMISGCVKCEQGVETLQILQQMQREGIEPDSTTFLALLNACARNAALEEGRRVHEQIIHCGCESDAHVCTSLVNMYAKCGSIEDAQIVFDKMPTHDVVSWTAMILGRVKGGQGPEALALFERMQQEGVDPDPTTFVPLLNACASMSRLEDGRRVHQEIIQSGCESDAYISTSLVDMYAKCGSIEDARKLFDNLPTRDVFLWTAMIQGYVKCEQGPEALELFSQMQREKIEPDSATFVALLKACCSLVALEDGKRVHKQIIQYGFECDVSVGNSLIDMYSKCGSLEDASSVFKQLPIRNVITWTAIILGCVKCGRELEALELYQQMQQEGVEPNSTTFVALINACASIVALEEGRYIHKQIVLNGWESSLYISNALVDMYAKCGTMEDAQSVFNKMLTRDVVSWTALILGFVKCGQGLEALELFQQMQQTGVEPDSTTFVALLNACASMAAIEEGRWVHKQIIQSGWESDAYIGPSLVDMYAKCGNIGESESVFNKMPVRSVVSCTAMITGYAIHGRAKEAISVFEQMINEGLEINELVFVCLLSACSHGGLVKEGIQYFESMKSVYGIPPGLEHYTCMVDLHGRAGNLDKAESIIKTMHLKPTAAVWMSLLSACRIHGNVKMGERVAKEVLKLDSENAAGYVLLSNIYAAVGDFDSQQMVQRQRLKNKAWKSPGCTWIEVQNKVHSFVVNDCTHPLTKDILAKLDELREELKMAGYIPDTRCVFQDGPEEKKTKQLWGHSEKLAIAFGLISTPSGAHFQIVKNLRVCGDCHSATKFISKISGRSITVRDAHRFHHFKEGQCSCGDYW